MKKILMGLFLITSLIVVAEGPYDYLEDKLEFKYSVLTDNKNNSLSIDGIDIGSFHGRIYVNMEIESFSGDGGWGKFDKGSYDRIAKQIADEIRGMLNTKDQIEITLILEKEMGKDMMLHNGLY
ncbi:Uncharacterised protein [Fusobacterium necrogenes]|uniref:Uncharacterized protein n=1 Tax=Fusobacterium necrogenes TaxID=858 RepID=A0A377H006_9FUSO|nr:hypothetical protein [Fusobacterium necrogenes]STO32164.1 Uncharacterised protein [Fusobacterium necrogenes]